ncbi:hypothetical protein ALC57_09601 [Trachymyrmex cornetzi]|uniref:Uncharacterized protein n=1 Tax=Trachymyrmex cornetzi TaxID=471704 RepID=A0A195DYZ8_9HYME|nr:hypothetical protein ALC57_09601 [Trachymyrmex cornetzi]
MHHKCRLSIGEITPGSRLIYDGVIAVCTDTGNYADKNNTKPVEIENAREEKIQLFLRFIEQTIRQHVVLVFGRVENKSTSFRERRNEMPPKNVDDKKWGCKWTLNIITSFHQTIQQDRNACVCTSVVYDWCECKYFRIYPTHAHQRSGTNNQTQLNGISTRL